MNRQIKVKDHDNILEGEADKNEQKTNPKNGAPQEQICSASFILSVAFRFLSCPYLLKSSTPASI